ncbi:MAG: nucleotidyltransferase domain-containing protein, partial [Candidatus Aenigmatarchaeota archaeon]
MKKYDKKIQGFAEDAKSRIIETRASPVYISLSGSHCFGWPSADSDYDIRGIHVFPEDHYLGLTKPSETIRFEDGELDFLSLEIGRFCRLLLKNSYSIREQISSDPLFVSRYCDELRNLARLSL